MSGPRLRGASGRLETVGKAEPVHEMLVPLPELDSGRWRDEFAAAVNEVAVAALGDLGLVLTGCRARGHRGTMGRYSRWASAALEGAGDRWVTALSREYQTLLAAQESGRTGGRRRSGAFYTPTPLVRTLVHEVLTPLAQQPSVRVLDPACGPGWFLLEAIRVWRELGRCPSQLELHGIDLDPIACGLCRLALHVEGHVPVERVIAGIRCADSLEAPTPSGAFDVVLGNPPFRSAIHQPGLAGDGIRGVADLSHRFLQLAGTCCAPWGRVALVLPRSVLNAPPLEAFRASPPNGLRANRIWLLDDPGLFEGASVYVVLLVLGPLETCLVSRGDLTSDPLSLPVRGSNWWASLHGESGECPAGRLGDHFEVSAGMTVADAYEARSLLSDSEEGPGARLLTTGLVDPGRSLWGERECRFLGRRLRHPRLAHASTPSLQKRILRSRRPKVLVAGLGKRIESLLDAEGLYLGAVSTFAIHHPLDDLRELQSVQRALSSEFATRRFRVILGANALGGGSVTMKKSFLAEFPWPEAPTDL
jgi:SAM-dependent methyltransferase